MAIRPLRSADRAPLRLGFLTPHNPFDRRAFSGTAFFAARALSARPDVALRVLGGYRPPGALDWLLKRRPARIDVGAADTTGLDAVIGLVATPLLEELANRRPDLPILHVTDATPAFLREAYGWKLPAGADRAETRVAGRAARVIYSSDRLAVRAAADLGLPGLRTEAVPFGVNFERLPETCPSKPPLGRLNLLFVGLDWVRKGGDIAVAALDRLNAFGIRAHLTVVGQCPDEHRGHPDIAWAGFLDKNRPGEAERLARLYREAHFLLLPSRADCTPMVIAEAMAHGTPVLATDTGGTASQIGGRGTGRLLSAVASPEAWAREIAAIAAGPEGYRFMSEACFDRSQTLLSWGKWAGDIERLARQAAAEGRRSGLKTAVVA
jgi:glycosyltransferase involved in cell wall biosynthesis